MLRRAATSLYRRGAALRASYTTLSQGERPMALDIHGTIGFIGVGNMGAPMAANLLKAGLPVLVFDRNPAAVDKLMKLGAKAASCPQEIGETPGVTAVVSMLPTTEHVKDAYEGPQGLLKASGGLQPSLLIDSSTILPTFTAELAQKISTYVLLAPAARKVTGAAGPVFVDAPVSGGVIGAVAGSLTFMCGGSAAGVRAAKPLLQLMGKAVQHLGEAGAGQVAKICNNLAMAIQMAAVSEALALGAAMGLDPAELSAVFNTSSARCWSSECYNPVPGVLKDVPAAHNYRPGFNTGFMTKDLRLALQLAGTAQQPLPMGEKAAQLYQQVIDASEGEPTDFGAIYKYVYKGREANASGNVRHANGEQQAV